ncbi:hypothetical protein ACFFMN_31605 [Planobispora siamensis]|uniref:Uncharacterized protein n=1 Tax=Planobispora siamensis TaxID=936338 RepID=A0A8J3SNZ6_9ACTN|nr:hypothetical protein [Planobispora siamensis]GIH97943.1 hypothetical protein Psi01_85730 [Planobispora siamensis]
MARSQGRGRLLRPDGTRRGGPRPRHRRGTRGRRPPAGTTVRASVRAAVALLIRLREHGTGLQYCTEVHPDEWIAGGSTTRYGARGFLERCRRNRHIGKGLEIPAREKLSRVRPTDEDERRTVSRRLTHDDDLAIEDRFAGLPP